jgi:flagellar protein FlaG
MQTMMINNTSTVMQEVTLTAPQTSSTVSHAESAANQTVTMDKAQKNLAKEHTSPSLETQQKSLKEATEKFNKMSEELNLDIKFAYNDKIDQVYLNVIDKNTGRVIRKLPSEEAMKISESMKELVGTLLDKKG